MAFGVVIIEKGRRCRSQFFRTKGRIFLRIVCLGAPIARSDFRVPSKNGVLLLTGEAPHTLENWVMDFSRSVYIRINIWCEMYCPVQWGIIADMLVALLGLVHNYGRHEEYTISSGKEK